ncbi:MAG: sigma-70 family RNA polymerase sigma factor [Deltaproteobacteria bacterium]|nr:sigma-70 family RNA polymerase sigma factor [Deltaproteobacteria bacterium]
MTSAARTVGFAASLARTMRDAGSDDARRTARDALAAALRSEAVRVLVVNGIPAQARDDLAQAVTVAVLARIVEGRVAHGFEDGYIAVAAKNRARDWHREQSGVYDKMGMFEEEALTSPDLDPHAVLERAEDDLRLRALAERVDRTLRMAPPRYRDVLVAVYLEGRPIDELVEQEMRSEWPSLTPGETAATMRRRARARVDKVLQRARDWMRVRLVADLTSTEGHR